MEILHVQRPGLGYLSLFLVLACFCASHASDDQEVVYEGNEKVVEGDPFEITCHLSAFKPVKWQHNEQEIIPDSNNQYETHKETTDSGTIAKLSVSKAQHSHSGSYRCAPVSNTSHQLFVMSANSVKANYDFSDYKAFEYDKAFTLQCNITSTPDTKFIIRWSKEDKVLTSSDKHKIIEDENKLIVMKANDADVGNYTCQAVNVAKNVTEPVMKTTIKVIGQPKVILSEDTPVVEGERLRLHCNVRGNPTPLVVWTLDGKPINTSDGRIRFEDDKEKNIPNAILVIDEVQMSDRNAYSCKASNLANQENPAMEKTTFVRVKDKLAALWPFLGICAEVIILCTIIFIYEKKRNKTELDESDTDQSPEQKNTPDHGKDVRQRK